MATPSSDNLLLGAGILYFDRFDTVTGLPTGERDLGHCSAFTLNTTVEKIEKYNSRVGARRLYKSVIKQVKAAGKITVDEFDPANLALALLGEEGVIAQTAQTGIKTQFPFAKDRYFKVNGRDITNVVVKGTGTESTTTLVLDVDYTVDAVSGRIYCKGTSTTGAALTKPCEATFDTPAKVYPKISGASVGKIEGMLRFIGDPGSGPRYEGEFWRISASPEGDIPWIGEEFASFGLNFECQDDTINHPQDPLYRKIRF